MARCQSLFEEKRVTSSLSEVIAPPSKKSKIVHIPEVTSESMPIYFPPGLAEICLHFLAGDIDPTLQDQKEEKVSQLTQPFTLFGRHFSDLMHPEAASVANLILHGEEKDVEDALILIKSNPDLLRYHTLATDPLGRRLKGTALQIAAMAGDVDLKEGIENQKDRGMVERLIAASNLSKEEVAEQLQCIHSPEAQKINEQRNQRILDAVKRFGKVIIESKADGIDFKAYQAHCKPLIDQLENDLQPDTKTIITKGYVFDPKILQDAMQWFETNVGEAKEVNGLRCYKSDIFWINGIGKLQSKLSSRDAQVTIAGIAEVVDRGNLPARTLNNIDRSCFFNSSSRLGRDFFLGYWGGWDCGSSARTRHAFSWETYVKKKQQHCKTYASSKPFK